VDRVAQLALLRLARVAVSEAAAGSSPQQFDDAKQAAQLGSDPSFDAPRAAFVTLHTSDGAVRGCVGTTSAQRALAEVVYEMARAAALRDPRFSPVMPSEVDDLVLEISVLDRPKKVVALHDVEIGRDGLLVIGRGRRGVLLPQVAEERGWDAATFAESTCKKAGLDESAYKSSDVELYSFGAEVFSEREVPFPAL
jgi:AmmeMemoRadiSam system protein A